MQCKHCKKDVSLSEKEVFQCLSGCIKPLLAKNNLKIYSRLFDPVKLEKWLVGIIKRGHLVTAEDISHVTKLASELYWSYTDLQLGMQHVLWAKNVGGLHKGISEKQEDRVSLPTYSPIDFFFWHQVGIEWEFIYRFWNRIANILNFILFNVRDHRSVKEKYYPGILQKAKKEIPNIGRNSNFNLLHKNIKLYNKIAEKRNKLSHNESSIFSRLKIELKISKFYNASTKMPYFTAIVTTANPFQEVRELKKEYNRIYSVTEHALKFIDTFVERSSIIRI